MRILHSRKLILVSKPRSGSTSLRIALDKYIEEGDVVCNTQYECWHPHHTALRLRRIFEEKGWDYDSYYTICTCRNPFELVKSYYQYFKPDAEGRYNYEPRYDNSTSMPFKKWVLEGRIWDQTNLTMGKDLSVIGIHNFCFDELGMKIVDEIFDIDQTSRIEQKLKEYLHDPNFCIPHANRSALDGIESGLSFDEEMRDKIRKMFETEFVMFSYG